MGGLQLLLLKFPPGLILLLLLPAREALPVLLLLPAQMLLQLVILIIVGLLLALPSSLLCMQIFLGKRGLSQEGDLAAAGVVALRGMPTGAAATTEGDAGVTASAAALTFWAMPKDSLNILLLVLVLLLLVAGNVAAKSLLLLVMLLMLMIPGQLARSWFELRVLFLPNILEGDKWLKREVGEDSQLLIQAVGLGGESHVRRWC